MIKKEDVIVVLTEANYVKRMPITEFKSQRRGGRGVNAANFKEGDKAKLLVCAHTHDAILCFSTKGKVFSIRVFDIPDTSRQARGKSINNIEVWVQLELCHLVQRIDIFKKIIKINLNLYLKA